VELVHNDETLCLTSGIGKGFAVIGLGIAIMDSRNGYNILIKQVFDQRT